MKLKTCFVLTPISFFSRHLLHSPDTANYYGGVSFPGLGGITQCMDIQITTECHAEIHKHVAKIIQRIFDAAKTLNS